MGHPPAQAGRDRRGWPAVRPGAVSTPYCTDDDERARAAASARIVATIQRAMPELVTARDLMDRFHDLIRRRKSADLEAWITEAASSLLASFVSGIVSDQAAVQAALKEPWSNGQTEGQNTKLKLIKRQMYGRAKLDLLRARLLAAP
jgi:transposase